MGCTVHITATATLIGDNWVLYSTFDSIDSDTIITLSATTRVMHMAGLYWRIVKVFGSSRWFK